MRFADALDGNSCPVEIQRSRLVERTLGQQFLVREHTTTATDEGRTEGPTHPGQEGGREREREREGGCSIRGRGEAG